MRVLLHSHVFLWWVADDARLNARLRRRIASAESECWFSHASIWEMAIKVSLDKLRLGRPVERFVAEHCETNGFRLLPISLKHICLVETLPWHHRNPFDRLLVAQALCEGLTLATHDPVLRRYGIRTL
jgi:PIN domain nuclease of toxin-antitoxin system